MTMPSYATAHNLSLRQQANDLVRDLMIEFKYRSKSNFLVPIIHLIVEQPRRCLGVECRPGYTYTTGRKGNCARTSVYIRHELFERAQKAINDQGETYGVMLVVR